MTSSMLDVRALSARYEDRTVLIDISMQVEAGDWFCLLGPNGVGKSTLLHCIAGRLTPCAGQVAIAGRSLSADPIEAKRTLGYACAPDELPDLLTGRQCLEIYASAKSLPAIGEDIRALAEGLRFARYLDQCVDTYSLGTRQKLCILLALLGAPSLIVLDEAFNGLDPAGAFMVKQELHSRLREQRCAVLLATHSLDIVEHHARSRRTAARWPRRATVESGGADRASRSGRERVRGGTRFGSCGESEDFH